MSEKINFCLAGVARCWHNRRKNCDHTHSVLVSCGFSVSLESEVLCWREACTVIFVRAQAFWAWQYSIFLSFIAGNNVLCYQCDILLTLILLFFPVFTETYLHLYFIHINVSISAASLYMFSYMRGKPDYYKNLQNEKAQDTESSRVDVPVWHIYKAQEK